MKKMILTEYCTISEIAKILKVSRHTLVHYEEEGLIQPFFRGENGYRYYSGSQIAQFKTIFYLREMGFSIDEIKIHLKDCNYFHAQELIQKRLESNQKDIDKLMEKRKKLLDADKTLSFLIELEKNMDCPFIKYFEAEEYSSLEGDFSSLTSIIEAMKKIDDLVGDLTWTEKYAFGFIIPKDSLISGKITLNKFAVNASIAEVSNQYRLPEGNYAVLYTASSEKNEELIERLLTWIKKQGLEAAGDLFLEDNTSYGISNKYKPYVKILKISVKSS